MQNTIFKNIVDAYASVSKSLMQNPDLNNDEFVKVVDFCLNDEDCLNEKNIKKNMLLFWALCKLAKAKQKEGKYKEALEFLQTAKQFVLFDKDKIKLGNKMLEIISVMSEEVNYRTRQLLDVSFFLHEVYVKKGDNKAETIL